MNLEDTINALTNAGFAVSAIYPYVIVSLKNRPVSILSVQVVLDFAKLDYSRSGNSVLIRF